MAIASVFLFTACNNDDDSGTTGGNGNTNPTTQQKIVGVWNGDSIAFNLYANGTLVDSLSEVTSLANQTISFDASGNALIDSAGVASDTIDWSVVDDHHIMFDGEQWHIDVLNSTNFTFSQDSSFLDTATSLNVMIESKVYLTK